MADCGEAFFGSGRGHHSALHRRCQRLTQLGIVPSFSQCSYRKKKKQAKKRRAWQRKGQAKRRRRRTEAPPAAKSGRGRQ